MGERRTQDSALFSSTWWGRAVEPGTDPWWKEAETGDSPWCQVRRTPGGLPGRDCVHPDSFSSSCFSWLVSASGCEAVQLPRTLQHSHRHLQSAQPCSSGAEARAGTGFSAGAVSGHGSPPLPLCWPCLLLSPAGLFLQEVFPAPPTHLCLQRAHPDSFLGAYSQSPFLGLH